MVCFVNTYPLGSDLSCIQTTGARSFQVKSLYLETLVSDHLMKATATTLSEHEA